MGFFSFITQDTRRSIPNIHQEIRPTFKVVMSDNKGNKWIEEEYDGYGEFGGKDFYELLAEMNGLSSREDGITLYFGSANYISPNLTESENWQYTPAAPVDCQYQGFFYY